MDVVFRKRVRLPGASLVVLCLLAGTWTPRVAEARGAFRVKGARGFTMKMSYRGETRDALVHVPKVRPGQKLRVIINYHGVASNGEQQAKYTKMAEWGTRAGFIVVHPNGRAGDGIPGVRLPGLSKLKMRTWDGINHRYIDMFEKNDDAGFTRSLIRGLEGQIQRRTGQQVKVDTEVVFATGLSNGAFLTHLLARRLPEIKGIAPVAGQLAAKGRPHRLKPILPAPDHEVAQLEIHGTADPLVFYRGRQGEMSAKGGFGVQDLSVLRTARIMAKSNGHSTRPTRVEHPTASLTVRTWGKDPRSMVKLITVKGGGHSLPGTNINDLVPLGGGFMDKKLMKTNQEINGTKEIVDFFKQVSAAYPLK
jgi:poly(3-hydroxybutyrate) depolymerase